jgi:hypothetical protein
MIRSKLTTVTVIGVLLAGSMSAFAQSSGTDAPMHLWIRAGCRLIQK